MNKREQMKSMALARADSADLFETQTCITAVTDAIFYHADQIGQAVACRRLTMSLLGGKRERPQLRLLA